MRKVWCEVLEAAVYSYRCLYRLSKIIEGNKTCSNCILHELEKMKSTKSKSLDLNGIKSTNDVKGINDMDDLKDIKKKRKIKGRGRNKSIESGQTKRIYSTKELSELLGKAERTIQH